MKVSIFFRIILVCMILVFNSSCESEEGNEVSQVDEVNQVDEGDEVDEEITDNSGSVYGIWVRTIGTSGDRTDIAIGGIANEPSNRVYMCEYKGSVGLYKGYIDGNTITWDETYRLPKASATLKNNQLELYYPSVSYSLPTLYDKGTWSDNCVNLSGDNSSSTDGNVLFWVSSDLGCGKITVSINGKSGTISQYYSSGNPNCGDSGNANFTLPVGTYEFTASCSDNIWESTITVTAGGCSKMRLYF